MNANEYINGMADLLFEIRPEDFYDLLCIFWDSGRQVIFNDHSAC